MAELDGVKEQPVYLRLWLGIIVVAEISLIGWIASAVDTASLRLLTLAFAVTMVLAMGIFLLHRRINLESLDVDLIIGIVMLAVALLFVGIALDAARDK